MLTDAAEIELHQQLQRIEALVSPLIEAREYIQALKLLSALKEPIDAFFEHVFIMAEDQNLRNSRLALLSNIRANFIKIADISMI